MIVTAIRYAVVIMWLMPSNCRVVIAANDKDPLYLLGLFPMTGSWPAGDTILAASRMAVDQINKNDSLLPDYHMVLIDTDSAVSFVL